MRIVIQNQSGDGYFDGTAWQASADHARVFDNVVQAENFCRAQNLSDAVVVVKFNDPGQDIRLPLSARNSVLVSSPPTTHIKSLS